MIRFKFLLGLSTLAATFSVFSVQQVQAAEGYVSYNPPVNLPDGTQTDVSVQCSKGTGGTQATDAAIGNIVQTYVDNILVALPALFEQWNTNYFANNPLTTEELKKLYQKIAECINRGFSRTRSCYIDGDWNGSYLDRKTVAVQIGMTIVSVFRDRGPQLNTNRGNIQQIYEGISNLLNSRFGSPNNDGQDCFEQLKNQWDITG